MSSCSSLLVIHRGCRLAALRQFETGADSAKKRALNRIFEVGVGAFGYNLRFL